MSKFTILWIAWGLAFAVIEGVALFNSTKDDTLSEHVWAFIGVRRKPYKPVRIPSNQTGSYIVYHDKRVSPKWTLKVARLVIIFGMVWLILHFLTGGWV